jgi:hypothetical protein
MATNNSVNSPLSGTTGSGNFVGATSPIVTGLTSDQITWSDTTKGIVGTTTNNDAAAGYVGQAPASYVSSLSPVTLTASTQTNITSLLLDAGDYDIYFQLGFVPANTAVLTLAYAGISTTSATLPSTAVANGFASWIGAFTGDGSSKLVLNGYARYSLASTTTIYLVGFAASSGNTDGYGGIIARRAR